MSDPFAGDAEFQKLLAGESRVDLLRLLAEFSADAYPGRDFRASLLKVEELAKRVRELFVEIAPPSLRGHLELVSRVFAEEGFRGNQEDYYDPRNSYLNDILDRRLGLPITLGIVYMAVAERAGIRTFGVSLPAHFMLGCESSDGVWYIDAFDRGRILDQHECAERIEEMIGQHGVLRDSHFLPAAVREVAVRVLRNIKQALLKQQRWRDAVPVAERLAILTPESREEQRDLGMILAHAGQPHRAVKILEDFVSRAPAEAAEPIMPFLKMARQLRAELN